MSLPTDIHLRLDPLYWAQQAQTEYHRPVNLPHGLESRINRLWALVTVPRHLVDAQIEVQRPSPVGPAMLRMKAHLPCNATGVTDWQPGRWFCIHADQSDAAIFRTFYLMVKVYALHELAESFKVRGVPIFEHIHG